jgi:hypothetical protein
MAAEAEGLQIRPLDGNDKTRLTLTGLLMEGVSYRNSATSLGPALVANSLCRRQEERTVHKLEAQIGNSG